MLGLTIMRSAIGMVGIKFASPLPHLLRAGGGSKKGCGVNVRKNCASYVRRVIHRACEGFGS